VTSVSGSSAVPTKVASGFGPGAILTPANLLTLGRIAATPPFLWHLARHPVDWTTLAMWFALCVTDLLDGKLARRHGATRSGAFLDPLADKVLVLGAIAVHIPIGVARFSDQLDLPLGVGGRSAARIVGHR